MALNLRGIANSAIQTVNPDVTATLRQNNSSTTAPSGKRTPVYTDTPITVQVQALSYSDLQQLDGLNIQGVRRAIYCSTQVFAIVRVVGKGGDLIVFANGTIPEGNTWLAAHVLERWPDWCKIAITLQNDG